MASWYVYKIPILIQHLTVTGKVISVHDMKVFTGSRGTIPPILHLSTRWRWVVNIMP